MDDPCQILYISEILRMILDNLTGDKRSIVSLAYTSKVVSGTALDYLWADMDSFAPFVPLLPYTVQSIWVSYPCNVFYGKFRFPQEWRLSTFDLKSVKCPPPEEWQLFDTYAYRVRRICPQQGCTEDLALYQRLASIRTGVYLFPRLSSLQCHLFGSLAPGMKLLPSSLRSLSLYIEHPLALDDHALELTLRQTSRDVPFLEELHIFGKYRLYEESASHQDPLDFKRLHTVQLNVRMVCSTDLERFSYLLSTSPIQNLRLLIRSTTGDSFQLGETCISPSAFLRVENISVFDSPGRAAYIISQIRSPYLKSVTINHRDHLASIAGYARSFTALAQRHPPISSLEIRTRCVYVNTPNGYVRGFLNALKPLVDAGLTKLRVEMLVSRTWIIEEDVKERLRPEAWPSLTDFEFVFT